MSNIKYDRSESITALHKKVKWEYVKNKSEFENILQELSKPIYKSTGSEKKRKMIFKAKFNLGYVDPEVSQEKFHGLLNSVILSVNKKESLSNSTSYQFIKFSETGNYMRIQYSKEDNTMTTTFIENDAIYSDTFLLKTNKKGKSTIKLKKILFLPITRDAMSQHTYTSRWYMNRNFKNYKREIERGLNI